MHGNLYKLNMRKMLLKCFIQSEKLYLLQFVLLKTTVNVCILEYYTNTEFFNLFSFFKTKPNLTHAVKCYSNIKKKKKNTLRY